MKKFIFFSVLLILSNTIIFGQSITAKPTKKQLFDGQQNMEQYFNKTVTSNTKVTVWSSSMTTASDWVASYGPGYTINAPWTWAHDTGVVAPYFKQDEYPTSPFMQNTTCTTGLFYVDANTPYYNNQFGTYNAMLKNATAINTLGYPSLTIRFYQLYRAFNADSTLLEISSDGTTWHTIELNSTVAVNAFNYGWYEYNVSQWAGNKAQVWIRFRFYAPELAGTPPQQAYGGGYGWLIDDVSLNVSPDNQIQVDRITLHDAYTQIPSGLGMPLYYDADVTNVGSKTQPHLKLHAIALGTNIDSVSMDTNLAPNGSLVYTNTASAFFIWATDYFYTPPTALGTYKVSSYISSDSIARMNLDTLSFTVVCDTCMYSRDNNKYVGSYWSGATNNLSDPYTSANLFKVNQDRMLYGVNFVVGRNTKVGSKVKVVLYKGSGPSRTQIAVSNNYYITAANIPTTAPLSNPPSISLPLTAGVTMQKDTTYWIGVQVYGGSDTVYVAYDNTGIPQWGQSSQIFDPNQNTWFTWSSPAGNVPAVMIRGIFNPNMIGINEVQHSVNLFSCMPNPASSTTKISYELKNNEKVNIIITDIMGRIVKNINQGNQTKGNYNLDIDLNGLTSGTYFCTIKTSTEKATEKLIIVK
jgi:hypothetical protein